MGHLSMGVGPSQDRASDDTAQNAASSCSGSDETAPPGRKGKPRSRPRPAHYEISIRPLTRALAETRTYAGGKHSRLPCCGPARGSVQRAGSLPHPRSPRNRLSESASAAPLYGDPVGQLLKLLCKVGQLVADTPERFVN